jgi:hypothetical protein
MKIAIVFIFALALAPMGQAQSAFAQEQCKTGKYGPVSDCLAYC